MKFMNWTGLLQNRLLQHLLFWALSFYVLLRLFAYNLTISRIDYVYTLLFHLSLLAVVYVNLLLLIPRLLRPGRYLWFGLSVIAATVAGAGFNLFIFEELADRLFPGYYFIAYYDFRDILQFTVVYLAIATLLKLSKGWFQLDAQRKKINRLEKEKLQAEMRALKAQIDPHFLLNTLNNLYSLALDGDARTAELLLRLSQSMRYRLYECGEDKVSLQGEIDFIRNYLELQQLRLGHPPNIHWQIEGPVEGKRIAPLLLMPFIENAFKHGLRGNYDRAFLHIGLWVAGEELQFNVENSKPLRQEDAPARTPGIGLQNTQKRLELLYPDQHQLKITDEPTTFTVNLRLTL